MTGREKEKEPHGFLAFLRVRLECGMLPRSLNLAVSRNVLTSGVHVINSKDAHAAILTVPGSPIRHVGGKPSSSSGWESPESCPQHSSAAAPSAGSDNREGRGAPVAPVVVAYSGDTRPCQQLVRAILHAAQVARRLNGDVGMKGWAGEGIGGDVFGYGRPSDGTPTSLTWPSPQAYPPPNLLPPHLYALHPPWPVSPHHPSPTPAAFNGTPNLGLAGHWPQHLASPYYPPPSHTYMIPHNRRLHDAARQRSGSDLSVGGGVESGVGASSRAADGEGVGQVRVVSDGGRRVGVLLVHEATFNADRAEEAKRKRHSTTVEALQVAASVAAG